jgi:hypothetical protein
MKAEMVELLIALNTANTIQSAVASGFRPGDASPAISA